MGDCLDIFSRDRYISHGIILIITEFYLFLMDRNFNFGQGGYIGQGLYYHCNGEEETASPPGCLGAFGCVGN